MPSISKIQRAYCTAVLLILLVTAFQNDNFLSRSSFKSISATVDRDRGWRRRLALKAADDNSNESISRGFLPSGPGDLAAVGNSDSGDFRSTAIRSQSRTNRLMFVAYISQMSTGNDTSSSRRHNSSETIKHSHSWPCHHLKLDIPFHDLVNFSFSSTL